jgi:hypothetical protein
MPLGKLIYMPEESTPTIATEGNREAVAYLELGEHADHYGRLFVGADGLLRALKSLRADVADWIEHGFVHPFDDDKGETAQSFLAPFDGAIAEATDGVIRRPTKTIAIHIEGGLVQDVNGIPAGYELRIEDYDVQNPGDDSWDAEKECAVTVYGGAS